MTSDISQYNQNPVEIKKLHPEDPMIDGLWESSNKNYPVWIIRNTAYLQWKSNILNFNIFGVFREQELIGTFGTSFKKQDNQWVIYDLVTMDNEKCLSETLSAACRIISEENKQLTNGDSTTRKISILATPIMESMLCELEFKKDKYNFTLAVHRLNKKQIAAPDHPSTWYVSAND